MNNQDNLPNFLKSAIEHRLRLEVETLVENAKKDLEKRTPEIIASVVVDMMKFVEFKTFEDRVVFEIRKK